MTEAEKGADGWIEGMSDEEFEAWMKAVIAEIRVGMDRMQKEFEAWTTELRARHAEEDEKFEAWMSELRDRWASSQCRYCARTHRIGDLADPSNYVVKLRCGSCGGLVAKWNACIDRWHFEPAVKPRRSGPHDDVEFRHDGGYALSVALWPPDRSWTSEHPSMACSRWCGASYLSDEVVRAAKRAAGRGRTSLKLQR